MKYYELMFHRDGTEDIICTSKENIEEEYGVGRSDLDKGNYLTDWHEDFMFYYDEEEGNVLIDLLNNNLDWFLISSGFKKVIEKLEIKEVQFLPVCIQEMHTKKEISGFSVLNITGIIDALDQENTIFDDFGGGELSFKSVLKPVLKEEKLKGIHLFRVKGDEYSIYISKTLKDALQKNKITGCVFKEIKVV